MQNLKTSPKLRRSLDNIIRFTSAVAENSVFTGTFSGGENIVVRGTVNGESDVQGTIVITESGHWYGSLVADVIIIAGVVHGHVKAREKIEILSTAKIEGDLQSTSIAIESGAVHDGRIVMGQGVRVARFDEKRHTPIDISSV